MDNMNNSDKQEDGLSGSALDLPVDVDGLLRMNRLREENNQLREEIKKLNVIIDARIDEFAKAKALAEDLEKENGSLKAEKIIMQAEIARLLEALKSQQAELQELVTVNESLSSAVEQMGINNEKLSSAEEKLAQENDDLAQKAVMDLEAEMATVASLREEIKKLNKRSILPPSAIHYAAAASSGALVTAGLLFLYKTLHRST